jgi:hypothetical protein
MVSLPRTLIDPAIIANRLKRTPLQRIHTRIRSFQSDTGEKFGFQDNLNHPEADVSYIAAEAPWIAIQAAAC